MNWTYILVVFCISGVVYVVRCERADTWDACNCHWDSWNPWSICDTKCYGEQVRERLVWAYDTPECAGSPLKGRVCDSGPGFSDYQQCNQHCTYGTYRGNQCSCPYGRYGVCCDNVVTCGTPPPISNGVYVTSSGNNYDSVVTYSCNVDYNMTGTATQRCSRARITDEHGYWTGSKPKCQYAQSCRSSPCNNGGTCVNGLDTYTCVCSPGWSGANCQLDVQAPVVSDCHTDTTDYTADRETTYNWTVPAFSDPFGNPVTTVSNYVNNVYSFPWGDFVIQYVATKPSNAMQTECKFTVKIRPNPCKELTPPMNGFVACNGWRSEYGQYCLIGCFGNYSLPRDLDEDQWYACGATGAWNYDPGQVECEDDVPVSSNSDGSPGDCSDSSSLRDRYIRDMKNSEFNSICVDHPELCTADNVSVKC